MAQVTLDGTQGTAVPADDRRAPSQVWDSPWLHASGPAATTADPARTGRWLLFPALTHHDRAWELVRDATRAGRLGIAATASTAFPSQARPEHGTIMVHTRDCGDRDDVRRVLRGLRGLGVGRRLVYKPDRVARAGTKRAGAAGTVLYVSPAGSSELIDRPGTPVIGVSPMVVVDVETTGLGACPPERVVEVAALRLDPDGTPVAHLETLVDPGVPIPPEATATHGICDAMVATAPPFEAIAGQLARLLTGAVLVGHYASFDYGFLYGEYRLLGRRLPRLPIVCTQRLTRRLRPDQDRYRLADCCRAFGLDGPARQSAIAGAAAAAGLLRRLLRLAASEHVSPFLDQPSAHPRLLPDGWGRPWPVAARAMPRSPLPQPVYSATSRPAL
jgi:DNA polymerase III epsilon subunit family exonuclease